MKRYTQILLIAALLLAISVIVYAIQWEVFHDGRTALFYLLQDLAFLPIQILLVAIILERILARQERMRLLHKMNMVIGTFFSEVGVQLLGRLTPCIANRGLLADSLAIKTDWSAADWKRSIERAERFDFKVDTALADLPALHSLLAGKGHLLTLLLSNPNLLEHERFTDLLWAVSHLAEELAARGSFDNLPATDLAHLGGDIRRVYSHRRCNGCCTAGICKRRTLTSTRSWSARTPCRRTPRPS